VEPARLQSYSGSEIFRRPIVDVGGRDVFRVALGVETKRGEIERARVGHHVVFVNGPAWCAPSIHPSSHNTSRRAQSQTIVDNCGVLIGELYRFAGHVYGTAEAAAAWLGGAGSQQMIELMIARYWVVQWFRLANAMAPWWVGAFGAC
jgi:hypothetical protein